MIKWKWHFCWNVITIVLSQVWCVCPPWGVSNRVEHTLKRIERLKRKNFGMIALCSHLFTRQYHMWQSLFLCSWNWLISTTFSSHKTLMFCNWMGLLPLHKCIIAIHIMVYGCVANACDEYFRLGKHTSMLSLKKIGCAICEVFMDQYLKQPIMGNFHH
jgi:hypothetical protein